MNLKELLEDGIYKVIEKEKTSQIGALSGSNALLYDGENFLAENNDHCPRVALLRRVGGIEAPRSVKNFLSNKHGRKFEDLLRDILGVDKDISSIEEEEAEVVLKDEQGNTILTARPDKILNYQGKTYAVEVKTVQSNHNAHQIFIKEKPKLGALTQLAIYMYGHQITEGFLLYAITTWHSGFAGKGNKWTIEPTLKVFEVTEKEDGYFYYNNKKSIVAIDKILQGAHVFLYHKQNNTIPPVPNWVDIEGNFITFTGCTYCPFKNVCENAHYMNLEQFISAAKEELRDADNKG